MRRLLLVMLLLPSLAACFTEPPAEAAPETVALTWRTLARLDEETGYAPPDIAALNGRRVTIAGFMVPLEDDASESAEFLLVPYYGACIHLPPPPPDQMVHVRMAAGSVPVSLTAPMVVEGDLTIAPVDSPYGKVSYTLQGHTAKPYPP